MFTWLSNSFCGVLGLYFSQIIKCTWMRKIYKNNGILLSWMIVIMILIMTAIWLCPLYAPWAQAEQSCSWHISTSLVSVMAKRELFSGKNPLLFNKENKRLEFCYLLSTQVIPYFILLFFLISLLRNKDFSISLISLEE